MLDSDISADTKMTKKGMGIVAAKKALAAVLKKQIAGTKADPYAGINWVERNPVIKDKTGKDVFNEKVIFPDYFTENSVKIVASKYLANSAKRKETSLRDMIDRVSDAITLWALKDGYVDSKEASDFNYKLKYYHVHQYFAFNSPVYFNIQSNEINQLAACFILSVEDKMDSITDLISQEARIFKRGSGVGVNLSRLRSSREKVRGGGSASGPVSFLKAADTMAGVIRSGGTLRRAAKLACLNVDHPDIIKFINCKDREEEKLRLIKQSGFEPEAGYELSDEVYLQNTNLSVRFSDKFMNAVEEDREWYTKEVLTEKVVDTFKARDLLMTVARHGHATGDPGVFFHDTINKWNPVPDEGEIESSNPCGEWNFLNNSVCNLAAHNLAKFFTVVNGKVIFDYDSFVDVIRVVTMAQDIFVENSEYPTVKIADTAKKFHAIGHGPSNLGALCMLLGFPYDSEKARYTASVLSSLMTGVAYQVSTELAAKVGTVGWWDNTTNRGTMHNILNMHRKNTDNIGNTDVEFLSKIKDRCCEIWKDLDDNFRPLRMCSTTLCAPTGTTGFLMGCTGFGIEPIYGNIIYKTLSGQDGASIKYVNDVMVESLLNLGYDRKTVDNIISDIVDNDIPPESSKYLKSEHVAIFDTASAPENGTRVIDYMGHVKMLAAIQPFISSAISKTINMSNDCSVQDVYNLYIDSWKMGLKSLTIYRDGSKTEQVMSSKKDQPTDNNVEPTKLSTSVRKKMPSKRSAEINKFTIHGVEGKLEGYITRGLYPNGDLGEVFIELAKDGSTVKGLVGAIVTLLSVSLQYGVPLVELVEKMIYRRFEPSGWVKGDDNVRQCSSIVDYIFRHLAHNHLSDEDLVSLGLKRPNDSSDVVVPTINNTVPDSSFCPICNTALRRLGSCTWCSGCSWSDGSCS